MSKYTKTLENGKRVAWGYDTFLGYFLQVFAVSDDDGEDIIVIEESSVNGMSNGKMIELMDVYKLPETHIERVAMDLPIE